MIIQHHGQTLHLHPLKAIFWEEQKALLIADLHLGKAAHFRKSGIAAPAAIAKSNFDNLAELLYFFNPESVLFLGDLFHSSLNQVWERFTLFLEGFPNISFELIKGNHDILPSAIYETSVLKFHDPTLTIPPFIFSHHPLPTEQLSCYNFYGHLHPGVILEGFGGQQLRLPCFHFGGKQAILPAFGAFTGLAIQNSKPGDRVFVIAEEEVLEV
ncbi:MAG: ligase-associated DNA damage response endonuclease PdeM [Saprospiraceae bacterium]